MTWRLPAPSLAFESARAVALYAGGPAETALTLEDAYAEGRKDEREAVVVLLREEAADIRRTGDGCKTGQYDWMADGIESAADALQGIDSATGKPATPKLMQELAQPAFWFADDGGSMLAIFRTESEWREFCAKTEPLHAGPLYQP